MKQSRMSTTDGYTADQRASMRVLWRHGHSSFEIVIAMHAVGCEVSAGQVRSWASRNGWTRSTDKPSEVRKHQASQTVKIGGWPILERGNTDEGHEYRDKQFVRALIQEARRLGVLRVTG